MTYQASLRLTARHLASVFLCGLLTMSLSGCDAAKNQLKPDRAANMEMQDFRDGLEQRIPEADDKSAETKATIPGLQPYIASSSTNMKAMPLVSISVNQTVPLRDVLFELAQQADYDIELDPRITGSIIFTARNRPFDEVVKRISDVANLRYKFENDVLRVELDSPYNKTYKIDYLSYIRTNAGSVRNNIAVVSGDGADTGSAFKAETSSEADFWGELENNLKQILGGGTTGALKTKKDPRITATEQNPDVQAVAPTVAAGDEGDNNINVQPPQAVLRVDSLPVEGEEEGASGQSAADENVQTFTINKQAGMVNVFATERAQKQVAEYLKLIEKASTAQVLIEAKVLEVTLNDKYATGIDWRAIDLFGGEGLLQYGTSTLYEAGANSLGLNRTPGAADNLSLRNIPLAPSGTALSKFGVGYIGNDVQALVQAISEFGTIRALASPRLTVLNNQSAVLNVATNQVFFEIDIDTSSDDGVLTVDIDSNIRNVPEGVLVNVQPSIDLDNGTVALAVRPTITRIVSEVSDPAVQFITATAGIADVESLVPELNVQEVDSVIKVRSGQPIVMGGLLQDRTSTVEDGVPILSEMPIAGALFRQHADQIEKTELVILLKATILNDPSESIHDTDRDLYRTFSGDRRPFKL